MEKKKLTGMICIIALALSVLSGCGDKSDGEVKEGETTVNVADEHAASTMLEGKNKARAEDVESAKIISTAVYGSLADQKVFDEVYDALDGKILAWAKEGQRFEDGGAGHERFLMTLNSYFPEGTPQLKYKQSMVGNGNFVPETWAVAYAGGKVEVYVLDTIYHSTVKDSVDKVQVYPDTDDNYKEWYGTTDPHRDAKDADIKSSGDLRIMGISALSSEAAYDDVMLEVDSGNIIAWSNGGGSFENGGMGYAAYLKELNLECERRGGIPELQYKEPVKSDVDFIPNGWAIAYRNFKPVIYITDGNMTKETILSTPKVEMQPDVDWNYKPW